ncbi:MAG: sulfite exporter TauE/SafE family protein [Dehalococcoidia bacterium]|nr:sulfite exporter TauE/SafE family protein [Dehalococcoidia bacterium]
MRSPFSRQLAVGVSTGVFSGLTGVGGGAMVVGLLASWLHFELRAAQGTSLAIIMPVALFGALTYAWQGLTGRFVFDSALAFSIIPGIAIPSLFGVVVGATWMSSLPSAQLRRAFGVFLFAVSLSMLAKDVISVGAAPSGPVTIPLIFWALLGFITGCFSGFLGIGGAMVIIPFMSLGAGLPQHMTQGVTLAVVAITTVVGTATHHRLGNVDGPAFRAIAPSATVAVVAASLVAGAIDGFWLTKVCGLALAYFAVRFTFPPATVRSLSPGIDPAAGFYQI